MFIDKRNYLYGKKLRAELMKRHNGLCNWCGVKVKDDYPQMEAPFAYQRNKPPLPYDTATIDHLDQGMKGNRKPDPEGKNKVLACWKCNWDRGQISLKEVQWNREFNEANGL